MTISTLSLGEFKINRIKIGVISDTHLTAQNIEENSGMFGRLIQIADKYFKRADLLIHAGDIESYEVIRFLEQYAPVIFVPGNGDIENLIVKEPEVKIIDKNLIEYLPENIKIAVAHDRKKLFQFGADPSINILIFGHSHIPSIEQYDNQYWINPGSVKRPWGEIKKPSFALINIAEKIDVKIEYLND